MAKLRLPLLSLEARGALGESIVFFPWKGIACARKYVIPSNPQTQPQLTQRGYITDIVADIHLWQGLAANGLTADDITAYAIYSRTLGKTMTWFNAMVRQAVLQKVATLNYAGYVSGSVTPGVDSLGVAITRYKEDGAVPDISAGNFYYGTSPTALSSVEAGVLAGAEFTATLAGLTTGIKYYCQFRATLAVEYIGTRSGIYSGVPI